LFLMPIRQNTSPEIIITAPATPIAGVIVGCIGRVLLASLLEV